MSRNRARGGLWLLALLLVLAVVAAPALGAPRLGGVYKVPVKIKADCSVAVDAQITSWLATVPDGGKVQFGRGRCYGQSETITLSGRTGLVIDGQGSEFRALTPGGSHRANWRFVGGGNLTVQNLAVRGSNPAGGYDPALEWQHGFSVEGVQGMTLQSVQAREVWGDGMMLWRSVDSPACGDDASSARNVVISGATIERIGRQGLAVVDAENVTLQDSNVGQVAWSNVDIESDDDCEIARHITIARNSFGANSYGVVANVGFGADPQVGDVMVVDNTQTVPTSDCFAPVRILSPVFADGRPPVYRSGFTFRGNRLLGTRNGLELRGVKNAEVSSNTIALAPTTGCGARAGVLLVDSHTVSILSNAFGAANSVFRTDTLSTGIASEGNTTG